MDVHLHQTHQTMRLERKHLSVDKACAINSLAGPSGVYYPDERSAITEQGWGGCRRLERISRPC